MELVDQNTVFTIYTDIGRVGVKICYLYLSPGLDSVLAININYLIMFSHDIWEINWSQCMNQKLQLGTQVAQITYTLIFKMGEHIGRAKFMK
jgi:hypothetical protein